MDITDHRFVPDRCRQLTELARVTFGKQAGAIAATEEFTRWYVRRPGMRPELCLCALAGKEMVSNVFVTLQEVQLGGRLLRAGLIDTVMTRPDYQRRGWATALLERAAAHMRDSGAALSLLYTVPDSPAYKLYNRLGYVDVMRVRYYRREPRAAARSDGVRTSRETDERVARAFLDSYFAAHDSYTPTNDALWQWRRTARPRGYGVKVLLAEGGDGVAATAAVSEATFIRDGAPAPMISLSDVTIESVPAPEATWTALLSHVPDDRPAILLSPECDAVLNGLAEEAGFAVRGAEAAMIRPLTEEPRGLLDRPIGKWYVITESVIGV